MDLEQAKFVDMRNRQMMKFNLPSVNVISTLPTSSLQKQIPFKIYEPTLKYDVSKFKLADAKIQERIDLIIQVYLKGLHRCLPIRENKALKAMIEPIIEQIKIGCKLGNPQCCLIGYICFCTKIFKQFSSVEYGPQLLHKNNHDYPLNLIHLGNHELNSEYFQKAISYGCSQAFLYYGSYLMLLGDYQKAYQMFRNAQHFGIKGAANLQLGKLFALGGQNFQKSPQKAIQHYQKSLEMQIYMDEVNSQIFHDIKNYYKLEQEKLTNIQTTQFTQAMVVSIFLHNTMQEQKIGRKNSFRNFSSTNNFSHNKSFAVIKKPKQFRVVFSPLMLFPGRTLLAKDKAGLIENIAIYGWEKIPIEKLKLLHKLGTKLVLYEYIRKVGANDNLPLYRVQNSEKVQIIAMPTKTRISDQQMRLFAKILFQKGSYQRCLPIYTFLLRRKCPESEVIYCNLGLTYLRLSKQTKAIEEFRKSISFKKNLKAQYNLVNCLINQRQFKEAKKIINQMQQCQRKSQVKKKIEEKEQQSQLQTSMKALTLRENKKQRYVFPTQYKPQIFSGDNFINIRQIQDHLLLNFSLVCKILGLAQKSFKTTQQYIQKVQKIIQIPHIKTIQVHSKNQKLLRDFFALAFGLTRNTPDRFDIWSIFKLRSMVLEKKIEDYAISMEALNQLSQAIKICQAGQGYSYPLCIRLANLYRKKQLYKQSIEIASTMAKLLANDMRSIQDKFNFVRLNLQVMKCKRYLKQINFETINQTYKILEESARYEQSKEQNQITSKILAIYLKHQVLINFQQYTKLFTKTKIKIQIERFFICQFLKDYAKAQLVIEQQLKFIQNELKSDEFYEEYFQMAILKLRIKDKNQKLQYIEQEIQTILKKFSKLKKGAFNQFTVQKYKTIILKQSLIILFKTKQQKIILNICKQSIQINEANLLYVFDYLKRYCVYHHQNIVTVITLIKKSKILKQIQEDFLDDIRQLISSDIDKFSIAVRQYFKLNEKQIQKEEIDFCYKQEQLEEAEIFQSKQYDFYEHQKWIKSYNIEKQFQQISYDQIDGYICHFKDVNGTTYIVIFEPQMFIPVQLYNKFRIAATKICLQNKGKNGIKFMKNGELRLKINAGARLKGKITNKLPIKMCIFDELEKHDNYKRK